MNSRYDDFRLWPPVVSWVSSGGKNPGFSSGSRRVLNGGSVGSFATESVLVVFLFIVKSQRLESIMEFFKESQTGKSQKHREAAKLLGAG